MLLKNLFNFTKLNEETRIKTSLPDLKGAALSNNTSSVEWKGTILGFLLTKYCTPCDAKTHSLCLKE